MKKILFFDIKKAFTLAEILITLGILGIIATMTIPAIVQNIQTQRTITAVKRVYSIFSQAYMLAVQENGTIDTWNISSSHPQSSIDTLNILQPYLKITKNCGHDPGCEFYKDDRLNPPDIGWAFATLLDNIGVGIYSYNKGKYYWGTSPALQNVYGEILIDINGLKSPNRGGVDIFMFYYTAYGVVPVGSQQEVYKYYFRNDDTNGGLWDTAWVIYNENMDYLKCTGLSWAGKRTCQ